MCILDTKQDAVKKSIRILYLANDEQDREAFFRLVRDKELPYEAIAAGTIAEARARLAESPFDVIVADSHLPDGDCTELIERLKGIPFILLTGALEESLAFRALEHGADDYLAKDPQHLHIEPLPLMIEKALHRQHIHDRERQLTQELAKRNQHLLASREMVEIQRRRYQELFDFAPNGYLVTDLYGLISDANLAACKMLKQTRDVLIGTPLSRFLVRHDRHKAVELLLRFREGSYAPMERIEIAFQAKGSPPIPCTVTINVMIADNGITEGLRWQLADIAERKEAEEMLRESEQRFRAIFEKAAVGIIEVGADDRYIAVNGHLCHILNFSPEELLGMTVRELTFPEDRPRTAELSKALQEGRVDCISYDKRYLKRDGSPLWAHVTVSAVRDFQGQFLYSIGTVEDISERKEAEVRIRQLNQDLKQRNAELATERERWQGVVEGIADEVWICDVQGRMSLMNLPSGSMLGWREFNDESPDDATQDVEILNLDGTLRSRKDSPLLRSLRGEILSGEEIMRHRPTGNISYRQYSSAPTRDAAGVITGAVAIVRDITPRKRMEQELKTAKNSAELANRAKDRFLTVLSQELRTPLTPVAMALSMLQDRQDLDADVRETLEMVRRNIEQETRLIDDLLDITRIARGKIELHKQRTELSTIISRAVEACKPDIGARRLHIDVDVGAAATYWIEADASRLQQIFLNLLKNAIKFTPPGGSIGVRCQPLDGHIIIDVTDSGVGIHPEALSRIFNAFEQAERSITRRFGGLGLGLAITKTLVEMHGGTIEAHSEGKGKGATFRVRLPLAIPATPPEEVAPIVPPLRIACPLHILLVEDHGITAKIIQTVLTAEGHAVDRAGDMASALEMADRDDFDLLISDLELPDGNGHDLMQQLRHRGCRFPGIALSGYGQDEDAQRSHEAGFAAHLTKPASREAVVETIASVMSGKSSAAAENLPTTSPADAPVFDVHAALKQCFGEQELLSQMIQFFFEDYEALLPQIHSALERRDLAELGKLGHRLKGTLFQLGAELAEEAAVDVERVCYYGAEPAEAEEAVRWLERECRILKAALVEYQATAMSI
jgi:PAS domain S-box-containing protein